MLMFFLNQSISYQRTNISDFKMILKPKFINIMIIISQIVF